MQTNPLRNILDHGWWLLLLENVAKSISGMSWLKMSWLKMSWLKISWLKIVTLFLVTVAIIFALERPAPALEVQFTPTNPRLGDTIDLRVNSPSQPTVSFNGQVYPAFPRGTNLWQVLLPTTPLDAPGTKNLVINDSSTEKRMAVQLGNRDFATQRIWLPGGDEPPVDEYEFDRVDEFKTLVTPERYWQGALVRPTSGDVTSVYGVRRYYNGVFAEDYYHRGVDYGAGTGTPVAAPAAGRISLVGRENQRFNIHGNTVGIDHGQGLLSIMLHLSRIDVREGDIVQAGQVIGAVGATGAVTGPHLHWGLYVHGKAIDPVPWREGDFD